MQTREIDTDKERQLDIKLTSVWPHNIAEKFNKYFTLVFAVKKLNNVSKVDIFLWSGDRKIQKNYLIFVSMRKLSERK